MFRLVTFIEDKKLPDVLHALAGRVISMEPPQPVVNASVKGGTMTADSHGGTMASMFIAHCLKKKVKQVTPKDVRVFLESVGRSAASCQHVLKQAVEHGSLRKKGRGRSAVYEVVAVK